jgi:SnoaL-like domain
MAVHECTALMHEYGYRFDHGAGAAVADLFVDDGEWSAPAVTCRGRAELIAFFRLRDAMTERVTRHVVTNINIEVQSADSATARSVAIEYRGTRGTNGLVPDTLPAIIGDYEDEFVRLERGWRFRRRRVVIDFRRAGEEYLRAPAGSASSPRDA